MQLGIGLGATSFRGSGGMSRAAFQAALVAILGDTRFLWMPKATDTTTSTSDDAGARTITWDATVAGRLSALGSGTAQSFASGSSQWGSTPDTNDLSFGNGATDSAFSIVVLANITDTAAIRTLCSKWNTALREYEFIVNGADRLNLVLADQSAAALPQRLSDGAIGQGAWCLFGATYGGGGGATAADGIALYQNGSVIASTATNAGAYVAMENLTASFEIGSFTAHTGQFFDGSLALVAVCQKALSAPEHAAIANLCPQYFGVP